MSAAEKLKGLGDLTLKNEHGITVSTLTIGEQMRSVRPQIVVVVEAANTAAASLHLEAHVGDVFRLSSALRALDEALS